MKRITFILCALAVWNITSAQIVDASAKNQSVEAIPAPSEEYAKAKGTFIRNMHVSIYAGTTVLSNEAIKIAVGKNNITQFGGELIFKRIGNSEIRPVFGAVGYRYLIQKGIVQSQTKEKLARSIQFYTGLRYPLLNNGHSSMYAETGIVHGEAGLPGYAYYTRFTGLRLLLGLERQLNRNDLRGYMQVAFESNREIKKYRDENGFYAMNQLHILFGLRF